MGRVVSPDKTNTPLVINTNAALASAVAPEHFQPVAGGYAQIIKPCRHAQLFELAQRGPLKVHPTPQPVSPLPEPAAGG